MRDHQELEKTQTRTAFAFLQKDNSSGEKIQRANDRDGKSPAN